MKVKVPYGTTAQNNLLTLPVGMLAIDMDKKALRIHDGVTQGGFEAIGSQAYIPPLGANWVSRNFASALANSATAYAYGLGIWVVVAGMVNFYTSPDGVTWTQRSIATMTPYSWGNIFFGNGLFIADMGDRYGTSTDGINWTKRAYAGGMGGWQQALYANSKWVLLSNAGARAFTSTDGTTWTSDFVAVAGFANGTTPVKLLYFNSQWISFWNTASGNNIATSPTGVTWTSRSSGLTAGSAWQGAAVFNGKILAVNAAGEFAVSTDGTTWTKVLTAVPSGILITISATSTHFVVDRKSVV